MERATVFNFNYHQVEPLTTRLHNLLNDSYTDGFCVPKELIQNADDAGATEVQFLLDERQNEDCREHLIHPNMASLQGPALWVYNDATFSDQDFANIVRLGAGTKREDASKVGKFGLGFNAVYNLTDVPCFFSRHTMAWFDPHQNYLPERSPGMNINFSLPASRHLLEAMSSQFRPFEGVFGCSIQQQNFSEYSATLFRLAFRSEEQAAVSDIRKEYYSPEKRKQLLVMLMERAGNLLLFTQNVKRLKVFFLQKDSASPSSMTCLMSVTKQSQLSVHSGLLDHRQSILKYCTQRFLDYFRTGSNVPDMRVTENVIITLDIRPEAATMCHVAPCQSQTNWLITWASGTNQSARLALDNKEQGLIPLAAAAVPLDDNKIMSMNNCPFGFYRHGHLFCFLPLPDQMEHILLPVHVNGTFALNSSRRNLLITTDENIDNKGGEWNAALVSDAVCRAYLFLLESVQDTVFDSYASYFEIWPQSENGLSLVENFCACLVNENFRVFPCNSGWVSFKDARFFDPTFRKSAVGDLAFEAALKLQTGQNTFVDIPDTISEAFLRSQQGKVFREKCLTQDEFYETIFFPSITSGFWESPDKVNVRDALTLHAVVSGSDTVKRLLGTYACIPCQLSRDLKTPAQLVHPRGEAAALFLPDDGRFPQTGNDQGAVDFRQRDCLETLVQLGMVYHDLEWSDVISRARSVRDLLERETNLALERAYILVDYLASSRSLGNTTRISLYSAGEIDELSKTEFLPAVLKPDDWPFPWYVEGTQPLLAAPCEMYHGNMMNLVACTQKIFDTTPPSPLVLTSSEQSRKEVLNRLSVVTQGAITHEETVKSAVQQLLLVARHHEAHAELSGMRQKTNEICRAVYFFLQQCVISPKLVRKQELIFEPLKSERSIWIGTHFCHPSQLAFTVKSPCPPYLQEVSEHDKFDFKVLFQYLGVKENLSAQDMLRVINEMKQDIGSRQLSEKEIESFCRAAQMLCSIKQGQDLAPSDRQELFLPDREGFLRRVDSLCLDDSSHFTLKSGTHFIHDKFSPEVAKGLGVTTKKRSNFKSHMKTKKFGQAEKLTNRIKRLLLGYTCDASIFKEFIQNADDAGATEIRFIKDFRRLGTDSVPDGWRELQGPALCVYNNADFTSTDIEGIQSLGEGSKGEEMMKTGQFGVGFNAVYHITDVPSFWTRRDGQEQVICVCDPCRLIPNEWQEPGMELEDIESLKEEYPDMLDGYLGNTFDMSQPSTLFRLPLRTKWMAGQSAIKKEPMMVNAVSKLLSDFMQDAAMCLLFLNNVRKIGIYSTEDGSVLETEYEVEMTIDEDSKLKKESFYRALKEEGDRMMDEDFDFHIGDITPLETVLNIHLKDSKGLEEGWIIVNRAGFLDASHVPENLLEEWRREHFRLLPRGGIAVKVQRTDQPLAASSHDYSQRTAVREPLSRVFCTLPLPVETALPVHINGDFALEHESRRNLWHRQGDSRTKWNELICTKVIAPAYVRALQQVKVARFGQKHCEGEPSGSRMANWKIRDFFTLFPSIPNTESPFWSPLVESFYLQVISGGHSLFPVTRAGSPSIAWTCVWKEHGFAGFFTRPAGCVSPSVSQPLHSRRRGNVVEETVSNQDLKELLKRLNMQVIDAPPHVFDGVKLAGSSKMREATPSAVLSFLKSCTSNTSGRCNLKNLPGPLADLELSEKDILLLADFVQRSQSFSSEIEGLPLCLLQSGTLDVFSENRQPFVTQYYDLFPTLSEEFLHGSLLEIFARVANDVPTLLRSFSIKDLADRLSRCLDPTFYKTGKPCPMDKRPLPHEAWLQRLWKLIEYNLPCGVPDSSGHENLDTSINVTLSSLKDWSLIPCRISTEGECLLYPIKDREKVLFLPHHRLRMSDSISEVLKKQPLPILSESIVTQSAAEKLVGSVDKPESIIRICRLFKETVILTRSDAWSLLNYFAEYARRKPKSSELYYLREIPMFCTTGGPVTSLDPQETVLLLPSDIPHNGLDVWSKKTRTALLHPGFIPDEICRLLYLDKSSNLHMVFWRWLLSSFAELPHDSAEAHILFIRDKYREHVKDKDTVDVLFRILSQTAFIRVKSTAMCKPAEFYSPHNSVFKIMCGEDELPPAPYCQPDWRFFMEKAGMVKDVTPEKFISFAEQVQAEGKDAITMATLARSSTLVKHLFRRPDLSSSGLLEDVRDICFVRPWSFEEERKKLQMDRVFRGLCFKEAEDVQKLQLSRVCRPFIEDRLVSFSESCRSCHWPLLWTAAPILHTVDEPEKYFKDNLLQNVIEELQFEQNVPLEKFKQHVVNVCQGLSKPTCDLLQSGDGRKVVEWLFEKIYRHLATLRSTDTEFFRNIPVVFDTQSGRLLYPEQVVIDLPWDEAIDGWLFRAPANYDKFYGLFQSLGVATSVTADHYARVLTKLRAEQGSQPLTGEYFVACKKAVQGVFHQLKFCSQMNEKLLYLPNEKFCLKESTLLIFNDLKSNKNVLRIRLQSCSERFLLDMEQLAIESDRPWDTICLLPEEYRMARLSDIISETVTESALLTKDIGLLARDLKRKLLFVEFVNGVARLICHKHVNNNTSMGTNSRQKIRRALRTIEIFEIKHLETVLLINNKPVAGSEVQCTTFRDKRSHVVFVDSEAKVDDEVVDDTLVDAIIEAVGEDLGDFRSLLFTMLRRPDVQDLLDQRNISYFRQTDLYRPGCYVNTVDLCFLKNGITNFYVDGEDVALEVYDPLIEREERARAAREMSTQSQPMEGAVSCDVQEMTQTFQRPEADAEIHSHQVFIYARVLEKTAVIEGRGTVHPWCLSYRVDIGFGRTTEVSAIRLYKVPADDEEKEEDEEAEEQEDDDDNEDEDRDNKDTAIKRSQLSADSDAVPEDAAVSDVKNCLDAALLFVADRRLQLGVIKRLCLQWHPDLNSNIVCPQVLEAIRQLTMGYNVCPALESASGHRLSSAGSLQPTPTAGFLDRVGERGRLYASKMLAARGQTSDPSSQQMSDPSSQQTSDPSSQQTPDPSSQHSRKNPQPGEGRRWLSQAFDDLRTTLNGETRNSWLHCLMCHQAAELALKAALFHRDADNKLLHPLEKADLLCLATAVGDEELTRAVVALERLTGEMWKMLRPSVQWGPQIPSQLYSVHSVQSARSLTETILNMAVSSMN